MDPDNDGDTLCDGNIIGQTAVIGKDYVLLANPYAADGDHGLVLVSGKMYYDLNDNGTVEATDKYICGGGEDLNGDGKIGWRQRQWHRGQRQQPFVGRQGVLGRDESFWRFGPKPGKDSDANVLCDGSGKNAYKPMAVRPSAGSEDKNDNADAAERYVERDQPVGQRLRR